MCLLLIIPHATAVNSYANPLTAPVNDYYFTLAESWNDADWWKLGVKNKNESLLPTPSKTVSYEQYVRIDTMEYILLVPHYRERINFTYRVVGQGPESITNRINGVIVSLSSAPLTQPSYPNNGNDRIWNVSITKDIVGSGYPATTTFS